MPRRYVAFVAVACVAAAPAAKAPLPAPPAPWGSLEAGRSVRILTSDGMRNDGWVRRGHAPQGALVGALVFGIPAAALGPEVACGDPGCNFNAADRVKYFFLGALPGAALGALIGSAMPTWTVFVPPPATSHG